MTTITLQQWEAPGKDGDAWVICQRDKNGKRRTIAHVYDEQAKADSDDADREMGLPEGMDFGNKSARFSSKRAQGDYMDRTIAMDLLDAAIQMRDGTAALLRRIDESGFELKIFNKAFMKTCKEQGWLGLGVRMSKAIDAAMKA